MRVAAGKLIPRLMQWIAAIAAVCVNPAVASGRLQQPLSLPSPGSSRCAAALALPYMLPETGCLLRCRYARE